MFLALFQTILISVNSTFAWTGFYLGIQKLPTSPSRRATWSIASGAIAFMWLVTFVLLASDGYFGSSDGIPIAILLTIASGFALLLSRDFRAIIDAIPQHWLIGIQVFRIVGFLFLFRWWQGEVAGAFAIPSGLGDALTGALAPFVAYLFAVGNRAARVAGIAWNILGMIDLVAAVSLGTMFGGPGGFPAVLIPIYAVPRAFLMHSYSLMRLVGAKDVSPSPAATPIGTPA